MNLIGNTLTWFKNHWERNGMV